MAKNTFSNKLYIVGAKKLLLTSAKKKNLLNRNVLAAHLLQHQANGNGQNNDGRCNDLSCGSGDVRCIVCQVVASVLTTEETIGWR